MASWESAWARVANPQSPKSIISQGKPKPMAGYDPGYQARLQAYNDAQYKIKNTNIYNTLREAGYTGNYVGQKNWGAYESMGGIGEAEANKIYQQNLKYGKESGDWSYMENFMQAAETGDRKYHRSGLFGTGFRISPRNLFLAGATAFAGAGGFGNILSSAGATGGMPTGHSLGSAAAAKTATSINAASAATGASLGHSLGSKAAARTAASIKAGTSVGSRLSAIAGKAKSVGSVLSGVDSAVKLLSPGRLDSSKYSGVKSKETGVKTESRKKEPLDLTSGSENDDNTKIIPLADTSRSTRRRTSSGKRYINRGRRNTVLSN